jgi:hypothetical protein
MLCCVHVLRARSREGARRAGELERELLAYTPTRGNPSAYVREAMSVVTYATSVGDCADRSFLGRKLTQEHVVVSELHLQEVDRNSG